MPTNSRVTVPSAMGNLIPANPTGLFEFGEYTATRRISLGHVTQHGAYCREVSQGLAWSANFEEAYGLRRKVAVRECSQVSVSMTWGLGARRQRELERGNKTQRIAA